MTSLLRVERDSRLGSPAKATFFGVIERLGIRLSSPFASAMFMSLMAANMSCFVGEPAYGQPWRG